MIKNIDNILDEYSNRSSIFVNEPFNGGGIFPKDTGLCNRLFHWELCQFLNEKNGFMFYLKLDIDFWPEYKFIDMPHTIFYEKKDLINYYQNGTKIKNEDIYKLNQESIRSMIQNQDYSLDINKNYKSNFGFNFIWDVYNNVYDLLVRNIKNISLKSNNIKHTITRLMTGVIGIHIRRGYGVNKNKNQLRYIQNLNLGLENIEIYSNDDEYYPFIDDEKYFEIIDRILKRNPKQKFYISTDLGIESLVHFTHRYPENILTYENVLNKIMYKYSQIGLQKLNNDFQALINIIDLFSLSYCDLLIKYTCSSWSDFAEIYRETPSIDISADNDDIFKFYLKQKISETQKLL